MKHYESQEEYLKAQANEAVDTGVVILKQGEKGDKGEPGRDGKDGKDGAMGLKGDRGVDGTNGFDGVDGVNGANGIDGKDGKDGTEITPLEVKNKLESLKKDDRLSIKAIKGIGALKAEISNHATTQARGLLYAGLLENNNTGRDGGAVDSVNGQTGVVVLTADDIGAVPYTGATADVDLGAFDLLVTEIRDRNDGSSSIDANARMLLSIGDIQVLNWYDGVMKLANQSNGTFGIFDTSTLTANQTYTLPDQTGTLALTSDIPPAGISETLAIAYAIAL